jgi:hypothetical protein
LFLSDSFFSIHAPHLFFVDAPNAPASVLEHALEQTTAAIGEQLLEL